MESQGAGDDGARIASAAGPRGLDPCALLRLTAADFRGRFHGTALMRTRRRGLLRNAALLLGTSGDAAALPTLRTAQGDEEELVRTAATWAISQIERMKAEE